MENLYLKSLFVKIFVLIAIVAYGQDDSAPAYFFDYDCKVDGVMYRLSGNEATVTHGTIVTIGGGPVVHDPVIQNFYSGNVVIPEKFTYNGITYYVTAIDEKAFYYCVNLTSVTIPPSIKSVAKNAFSGCSGLTTVNLNNNEIVSKSYESGSVKTVFGDQVKEYILGEDVTSIGSSAFSGCSGLTSVTIPESVTSIGQGAFRDCNGLTSVIIEDGAENLKFNTSSTSTPFSNCPITELYLGRDISYDSYSQNNGWQTIWYVVSPFEGNKELKSLTIGESVTSIGSDAFRDCSGLTSVVIPNSVTSIGSSAFSGCSGLTSVTIPNSVTGIGEYAFSRCSGLTSVTIPESVTSIGQGAFRDCNGLTSVIIEDGAENLKFNTSSTSTPFSNCPITELYLGRDISYDSYSQNNGWQTIWYVVSPFEGNKELKSLTIGESVTSIGSDAFRDCSGLTSVVIPNSVIEIGAGAFSGCSGLTSVTIPDNVKSIGSSAFGITPVYVKKGTKALPALWSAGYYTPYEQGTDNQLIAPSVDVTSTQTTVTFELKNAYSEYTYKLGDDLIDGQLVRTGLRPLEPKYGSSLSFWICTDDESFYIREVYYVTTIIDPSVSTLQTTASSLSLKGSYKEGDAHVISQGFRVNGTEVEGNHAFITGLDPNRQYTVTYYVNVAYGEKGEEIATYTNEKTVTTAPLTMTTLQPKVISSGNVIVAAESNLNDEETNVGFEWRRTDWTDEFPSNTGSAALYEGTMEGYIRNLNTEKLWKFRPYYLSSSGTYYYGDWMGLDPTNTSYFNPTVHTYAKINVNGNTALVKGYALGGTDKVAVQGFMYWKKVSGGNAHRRAISIPSNAKTVEASGQVMTAELTGLDYNAEYIYVAFVKTVEGELFYGEEQTFTTGEDPTGIEYVDAEDITNGSMIEIARYNMNGQRIDAPQPGVNIIRYSNGQAKKVFIK